MNIPSNEAFIKEKLGEMTLEELAGQLLCFQINTAKPIEEFEEMAKRIRPGGIFFRRTHNQRACEKILGTSVMCPPDRLSETFINAGGDMLLFPTEEDFDYLMDAINAGRLSEERLRDAVSHIIALKIKVRLFENQEKIAEEIKISEDIEALSNEIAEKSITVIRNSQNLIPLSIKKG